MMILLWIRGQSLVRR
uniref:Uncharacterized protein n=1 Tax=Arundo donax TaxID=35708 RepID=A0A0A9GT13_ARUDO